MIGYGNGLRGDDAVGLHVAEAVADLGLPDVEVRSMHQLTPELAVEIGRFDRVVFIDADVGAEEVAVRPVRPEVGPVRTTHHLRPPSLLALAAALGEPVPDAVAVAVPAADLRVMTTLSAESAAHVADATGIVVRILSRPAAPAPFRSD